MISICRPQEGEEHLLDSQWTYLLKAFGVEEVPIEKIGDRPVVVMQPESGADVSGEISLENFIHPMDGDVVYLFGGSHAIMREKDLDNMNVIAKVFIPCAPSWELFSPTAAAIVIWDWMMQHG